MNTPNIRRGCVSQKIWFVCGLKRKYIIILQSTNLFRIPIHPASPLLFASEHAQTSQSFTKTSALELTQMHVAELTYIHSMIESLRQRSFCIVRLPLARLYLHRARFMPDHHFGTSTLAPCTKGNGYWPHVHKKRQRKDQRLSSKVVSEGKRFREVFELRPVELWRHIRILARDPPTTRSEGFSLLCFPVWGGAPFLSDLGVNPYELTTMSTPDLRRARLPHPVDSVATTRVATLVPHYPDRSIPLQVGATRPGDVHVQFALTTTMRSHHFETASHKANCQERHQKETRTALSWREISEPYVHRLEDKCHMH